MNHIPTTVALGSLLGLYPSESLPFASEKSATPQPSSNGGLSSAGVLSKEEPAAVVVKHILTSHLFNTT